MMELEKDVERWLGQEVRKLGGLWFKFTSPGRTGVPDRILILQGQVIFVEMKTAKGTLSAIQKATIRQIVKDGGVPVHVVYGRAGAEKFLADLRNPWGLTTDEALKPDLWEWKGGDA